MSPSSSSTIDEYDARLHRRRVNRLVEREGQGGWIAGSLTAHHGVRRLLPNHFLDLETFTSHRFWPRQDTFEMSMSVDRATDVVAPRLTGFVEAVATQFEAVLTLTAGYDSRLLLAAARNVSDRMTYATFGEADQGLDQIMASQIAEQFGLDHRLVPHVRANEAAVERWDRLVGHAVREVTRHTHPTLSQLGEEVMLTGMYGEIGRCRLYRRDAATINDTIPDPDFVVGRLTLPADEDVRADVEHWLEGVAWLPTSAILDLAFNELRCASHALGQGPVQKALKLSLMPFAQWQIQEAFMSVRPEEKGLTQLFDSIAQNLWAETLQLPINRYGDYRDYTDRLVKVVNRERLTRLVRKLRA